MAEEMQDLSVGDMEAVAGGKVRITTPTHTDRMDTKKTVYPYVARVE
jgi:hypothetical protein